MVPTTSAKRLIKFLEKVFLDYGDPEIILSDQGTAFTAKATRQFFETKGCYHAKVPFQRPNANGQVERINKEAARLLKSLCKTDDCHDWASHVRETQVLINRLVNRSTGKASFEALHGYLPRLNNFAQVVKEQQNVVWVPTEEVQAEVRGNFLKSQNQYAYHYDKKRRSHYVRFNVGDIVVVSRLLVPKANSPVKFQPKFRGPMIITEVLKHDTSRLAQLGESYSTVKNSYTHSILFAVEMVPSAQ